jgi:hypothetical protein
LFFFVLPAVGCVGPAQARVDGAAPRVGLVDASCAVSVRFLFSAKIVGSALTCSRFHA